MKPIVLDCFKFSYNQAKTFLQNLNFVYSISSGGITSVISSMLLIYNSWSNNLYEIVSTLLKRRTLHDIILIFIQDPPSALDSLVATSVSYLITTNSFKKIESIKQFHQKIYQMDEAVLTQLAIGTAELGNGETVLSFCRILNLWAGEQR